MSIPPDNHGQAHDDAPSFALGSRPASEMLPPVYAELRRLAAARLARYPGNNTLQPTALVHEAYMQLVGDGPGKDPLWKSQAHFSAPWRSRCETSSWINAGANWPLSTGEIAGAKRTTSKGWPT